MKASHLIFFAFMTACSALGNAQSPTPDEQKEKARVANHGPGDPDLDILGLDMETCSAYVGRKLRRDEWLTNEDFQNARANTTNATVFNLIDTCAFFMPKSMQLNWVKDDLRKTFQRPHNPSGQPGYPSSRSACSKMSGSSIPSGGFLTEKQFLSLLRKTKPQQTIDPCLSFITADQYERWLDHEALYWLNFSPRQRRHRSYTSGWH